MATKGTSLNRTFMELKYELRNLLLACAQCLNRTFMVLKCNMGCANFIVSAS